jgi:hypothetical protein
MSKRLWNAGLDILCLIFVVTEQTPRSEVKVGQVAIAWVLEQDTGGKMTSYSNAVVQKIKSADSYVWSIRDLLKKKSTIRETRD